ncbi:hypothetical protein SAY86_001208 [Trapa natans]|uniref:Saposin B-type domain-containing protein n=1 Tax=Trapa natans TaxID=22666 RepID=A0AAN7MVP3_TRANT|nr:hypothetical protein SAY86_001208 [Trapa natans]
MFASLLHDHVWLVILVGYTSLKTLSSSLCYNQMDIIEMLMHLCNSVEKKYVKKCKRMVFEYGPLVLANAEQFLEAQDLCTTLHACKLDAISAQPSSNEITKGLSES